MTSLARHILSTLIVAGTFAIGYFAVAMIWFPGALATSTAAIKLLFPPSLQHVSEPSAHPPGSRVDLPALISLSDEEVVLPPEGTIALIVFDVSCRYAADSVPFWRRANAALVRANVSTVFAACAPTLGGASSFARENAMEMPLYYLGKCTDVTPRLKLGLQILQYVLDERRRVVSAWGGMPLYRYAENNVIAQMVNAATTRPH